MKKRVLLILFCLTALFGQKVAAQAEMPQASTADNPIWYYIQVKGTDTRKDRILYATANEVSGRYFSDISAAQRGRYLWRIEKAGDGYYIINQGFTDRPLNIVRDEDISSDIICVKRDTPYMIWTLEAFKDYFLIKSDTEKYAFHGRESMNYVILASTFGASDNGSFSFIKYDDSKPEESDTKDIWYYIYSAQTGNTDKCITDVNALGSSKVKFGLEERSTDLEKLLYQQWKVIKPANAINNNVHFVNRATGNIIQTEYDYNGYYNAQSTTDEEDSNGWTLTFIELSQFKISGLDKDGITGYLNITSDQEAAPALPTANSQFFSSAYAWTFVPVDPFTSIENILPDPFTDFQVSVINRRIVVEGTDNYTVSHISGIRVSQDIELPVGVYLVTIDGRTKSYLVK